MSIKKQISFGLFGMAILTCLNVFVLIFITAIILSSTLYHSIIYALEKMDNNMINIFGHYADYTGTIFMDEGKLEIQIIRFFYKNLDEIAQGINFQNYFNEFTSFVQLNNFFIKNTEINESLYTKCKRTSNCYYLQIFNSGTFSLVEQTIFTLMIPLLTISMKVKPYDKYAGYLFDEIYFALKEKNLYLSFPFDENKLTNSDYKSYSDIAFSNLTTTLTTKYQKEIFYINNKLNTISESDCNYDNYVLYNPAIITNFIGNEPLLTPFYKIENSFPEIGSFSFLKSDFQCGKTTSFNYLIDYIGGKWERNVINRLSLSLTNRVSNTESLLSMSWEVCSTLYRLGIFYSDEYNGNKSHLTTEIETGNAKFSDCFFNKKAQEFVLKTFKHDITSFNQPKFQMTFASYNYSMDINQKIVIKLFKYLSPNNYVRSLSNSTFFCNFSYFFFFFKIQNKILIDENDIYFHFINAVFIILVYSLTVWIVIFIILWIRINSVAKNISYPIQRLIQSISNSDDTNTSTPLASTAFNNRLSLEEISYKDDKDIDDLFKVCQKLIVGGFQRQEPIKYNNTLHIYNSIAVVKTNNFMINEDLLKSPKDIEENEIFKDQEVEIKNEKKFQKEVYQKFQTESLNQEIQEFIKNKYDILGLNDKKNFNKSNNQDFNFLFLVNKDMDNDLTRNSLYKIYHEEITLKTIRNAKRSTIFLNMNRNMNMNLHY